MSYFLLWIVWQLNLYANQLCGLDSRGRGTYTSEGITAVANALRVNGSLTSCDVRGNDIVGDGASQLSAAVLTNTKIEKFNEIPIKEMRADSLTELDLKSKKIGVEGSMVVAGLVPVMGSLTSIDVGFNSIGKKAALNLVSIFKEKQMTSVGLAGCDLDVDGAKAVADYVRVTGSLTSVWTPAH